VGLFHPLGFRPPAPDLPVLAVEPECALLASLVAEIPLEAAREPAFSHHIEGLGRFGDKGVLAHSSLPLFNALGDILVASFLSLCSDRYGE